MIDQLVAEDLRQVNQKLGRHAVPLGDLSDGTEVTLEPYGRNVLITGTSGAGKSTIATGILERLAERDYQFCVIDPEGDYSPFAGAVVVGDTERPPTADEIMQLVTSPGQQVIVNTMGVSIDERPAFFGSLYTRLQDLRAHLGRPHWIALDEAHHLLPSDWNPTALLLPEDLSGILLLTVRPEHVAPAMLRHMDLVIVVGVIPKRSSTPSAT